MFDFSPVDDRKKRKQLSALPLPRATGLVGSSEPLYLHDAQSSTFQLLPKSLLLQRSLAAFVGTHFDAISYALWSVSITRARERVSRGNDLLAWKAQP